MSDEKKPLFEVGKTYRTKGGFRVSLKAHDCEAYPIAAGAIYGCESFMDGQELFHGYTPDGKSCIGSKHWNLISGAIEDEKLKLTLPLVVGQRVVCRDGKTREVGVLWFAGVRPGVDYICGGYVWANSGRASDSAESPIDALHDAPDWKPEEKKAEAGAGTMPDVGSRPQGVESARKSDAPARPAISLQVGKNYRTRGGWKATVEYPYGSKYAVRHEVATSNSVGSVARLWHHSADGFCCYDTKESERHIVAAWDEQAEAALPNAVNGAVGNLDMAKPERAEGTPLVAQPAIPTDREGFYRWMWGYPIPFEVGKKPEPPREELCPACHGDKTVKGNPFNFNDNQRALMELAHAAMFERKDEDAMSDWVAFGQHFFEVSCPECHGSGVNEARKGGF